MPHDPQPEVHHLDIGTKYRVRVQDEGGPFDPTDAIDKLLWFKLPDGTVLEKTASVEAEGGSPATDWFLTYTVLPDAGPAGSPAVQFHELTGAMKIQAVLRWTDGSQYHSSVQDVDNLGRLLRVHPNLQ